MVSAGAASAAGPAPRRGRAAGDGSGGSSSLERPSESTPITLAGSERRRVVGRDTGAGAVAGSAHGSIVRWGAVERDTGAGVVAGSAHGSTAVAARRGCAAPADGMVEAAGRGDVARGVDSVVCGAADGSDRVVAALGSAASFRGAGAAGGVAAFTRAARAAGLFESKGGGSVGFLTWSGDGVESAGPAVFAGGGIAPPLCA